MGQNLKRLAAGISAMFAVTFAVVSCAPGTDPLALSDQELSEITDLVQEKGATIDSPACQVEVFRIEDATTYGWATCTSKSGPTAQAESFPFRIDDQQVQRPGEGAEYAEDIKTLFPEDLRSAIEQHATGVSS